MNQVHHLLIIKSSRIQIVLRFTARFVECLLIYLRQTQF